MKKFFIGMLLVCSMLLSLGTAAYAAAYTVDDPTGWNTALGDTDTDIAITLNGDINVGWIDIDAEKKVTINGSGTLTCEGVDVYGILILKENVSIISEECVTVDGGGTFSMEGGSVTVTDDYYAVEIASEGFFKLSGGTIRGNVSGVCVGGSGQGGFDIAAGAFEMSGGTVIGSTENGVENKGAFTMTSGSIEAAKVGVSNEDNGSFTMTGGSVAGGTQGLTGSNLNLSPDANIYDGQSTVPPAPVNPPAPNNPAPVPPAAPAAPVVEDIYYIPATDDNSNMALWSILALALLSTAFVTRKRKNEN